MSSALSSGYVLKGFMPLVLYGSVLGTKGA